MPRSFDWLATPYATLETLLFGSAFQRLRRRLSTCLEGRSSVLVLGEGDGRFAEALLRRNPEVRLTIVDRSARMLQRAAERVQPWSARVDFVHADAVTWLQCLPPHVVFDAVVTTYFLDCLTPQEVACLFDATTCHLATDGKWLWADFVLPRRGIPRLLARLLLAILYRCFRVTTNISARRLTDPMPHFERCGWHPGPTNRSLMGLLHSCVWSRSRAQRELKNSPRAREFRPKAAEPRKPAT